MLRYAVALGLLATAAAVAAVPRSAPASHTATGTVEDARRALDNARIQQRSARARAEQFARQAASAQEAADRAVAEAAALAARVQLSETGATEAEARLALAQASRRALESELARERAPLARLVGAVETLSRRPLTLALFQQGSLGDLVHTRAVLDSAVPLVEARTRGLRRDLARLRALEAQTNLALADRQRAQRELTAQRRETLARAEGNRLLARRATGDAGREAERAMVLAEEARDLDALAGQLEQAGSLRARLASLQGPVLRPANPAAPAPVAPPATPSAPATAAPDRYLLPVAGRIASGFGETAQASGARRPGIVLAARPGAQAVAPGAGRIAFAGPYAGFGRIVIVEHANGWTSLVTGLGEVDVTVGQQVAAGSPIGRAAQQAPEVTLELRRAGQPVNPLDHLR